MKKIIAIVGFLGLFGTQAGITSAGYFNAAPISRCETQITRTLQMGDEGLDVHIMQLLLQNAGFLQATPNAHFGYQTQSAVRNFQANNGISPTGIVGPSTRDAINERLCDTDLLDNTSNYISNSPFGYSDGVTYVTGTDPFVRVVSPSVIAPAVYNTPQAPIPTISYNTGNNLNSSITNNSFVTPSVSVPFPSANTSQIQSTNIIYSPSIGYTYGIVPQSGSVTVSSPLANAVYNEGDTVNVAWATSNLNSSMIFSISLESNISGQSKIVATTAGNGYSFVLTKELLDAVCSGSCNNQQGSFRIVVSTPTTDIAGITSNLKASIAPITLRRPLPAAQVSISASKTPVNSNEVFRLYVNVPTLNEWNGYQYGSFSFRIKAICVNAVTVSIAGTPCGQEFSMPVTSNFAQQEVPAVITNSSWYKQDVVFIITAINAQGQAVGTAQTVVTANAAPFNW